MNALFQTGHFKHELLDAWQFLNEDQQSILMQVIAESESIK